MFCPQMSRLAHQIVVASEYVEADVVEVDTFPELAHE